MPIKRARSSAALAAKPECRCEPTYKHRSFWVFFAFLFLFAGVFIMGSITALLYRQQISMALFLNNLGVKVDQESSASQTQNIYQASDVSGLYLAYQACAPSFTGACDDASLYRLAADGSKQIIIPSLRRIPGAPMTNELLQPIELSVGGQYIVFGAWAFGSGRNANDRRIWLYDTKDGSVLESSSVPVGAVFSPDYKYAAYASFINNDMQDLMIVNLKEDKVVSGAKAKARRTFMGPTGVAAIRWQDAKNLFIKEYITDMTGTTESGEVHVKVK
ncbi:MAG: hypothetical protein ACYC44_04715 [Patescibacteria group bacterium]